MIYVGECFAYVHPWLIHVNVWQNQYSIVKQNKVKIKIKKVHLQHLIFKNSMIPLIELSTVWGVPLDLHVFESQ